MLIVEIKNDFYATTKLTSLTSQKWTVSLKYLGNITQIIFHVHSKHFRILKKGGGEKKKIEKRILIIMLHPCMLWRCILFVLQIFYGNIANSSPSKSKEREVLVWNIHTRSFSSHSLSLSLSLSGTNNLKRNLRTAEVTVNSTGNLSWIFSQSWISMQNSR